jgi:hypothetical protein
VTRNFHGRNFRHIAHASRLPDREEKELLDAVNIISMMIKNTVDGLSTLHDDTPYWLRTANSTNRVENRPMVRLQNVESLDRYIGYWKRSMCYCLRVHAAQRHREERQRRQRSEAGEAGDDVNNVDNVSNGDADEGNEDGEDDGEETEDHEGEDVFAETNEEEDMFVEVEEEEGEVAGANEEDVEGDEEDEEFRCMKDCCELANFNVEQKQLLQEMQDSLEAKESEATQLQKMTALSISFIIQSLKGFDRFYSPMVHFAAVIGIDEDGNRLYRGDEYSFKLAGLSTVSGFYLSSIRCPQRTGRSRRSKILTIF